MALQSQPFCCRVDPGTAAEVRPAPAGIDHSSRMELAVACAEAKRIGASNVPHCNFRGGCDSVMVGGAPEREIEIPARNAGARRIDLRGNNMAIEEETGFRNAQGLVQQGRCGGLK